MTDLHPLTEEIIASHPNGQFGLDDLDKADWIKDLDAVVRMRLAPEPTIVESGVRFTGLEGYETDVQATFIQSSSGQLQMAMIGTEPVLLVQPNFDLEDNQITLIVTAVDLPPAGLVEVLKVLLDSAEQVVSQQAEMSDIEVYESVMAPD